jgi:hypothetical protein
VIFVAWVAMVLLLLVVIRIGSDPLPSISPTA